MRALYLFIALSLVFRSVGGQEAADSSGSPAPSKAYFWIQLWPDSLAKYDPATDQVVGQVKHKNGLSFGATLSHDERYYFIITGQRRIVEIIDRKTMSVVDEHRFAEQGFIIRVDRVMEVPGFTHWYVRINKVKLDVDKYVVEAPEWLYYNLKDKKIEKRMKDLPQIIRNGARVSPDGTRWHVFSRDIVVVDPVSLEEEGRVELSKPMYDGLGPIRVRGIDFFDRRDKDRYRMLYSMNDPVLKRRTLFGVVDIDMKNRVVSAIDEWGVDPGGFGLELSHDKKRAVTRLGGGGGRGDSGDERMRIGLFDMTARARKLGEFEIKVRPRRWLSGLSPDGSKIYVGGAGNDFEVYSDSFQFLKTVTLPGDLMGGIDVLVDP